MTIQQVQDVHMEKVLSRPTVLYKGKSNYWRFNTAAKELFCLQNYSFLSITFLEKSNTVFFNNVKTDPFSNLKLHHEKRRGVFIFFDTPLLKMEKPLFKSETFFLLTPNQNHEKGEWIFKIELNKPLTKEEYLLLCV